MHERIRELYLRAHTVRKYPDSDPQRGGNPATVYWQGEASAEKFAQSIVQECINEIETYQIPVGNSSAGEMACKWTYAALKEIRDEIKQRFGVKP